MHGPLAAYIYQDDNGMKKKSTDDDDDGRILYTLGNFTHMYDDVADKIDSRYNNNSETLFKQPTTRHLQLTDGNASDNREWVSEWDVYIQLQSVADCLRADLIDK